MLTSGSRSPVIIGASRWRRRWRWVSMRSWRRSGANTMIRSMSWRLNWRGAGVRRGRVRRDMRWPCVASRMRFAVVGDRGWWASKRRHRGWQAGLAGRWSRHFDDGGRGSRRVRFGGAICLATLVALKSSLFNKLLRLTSECAIVSVCELAFLRVVDGPPLWTDINTAGDADLLPWLACIRGGVSRLNLPLLVPYAARRHRRRRRSSHAGLRRRTRHLRCRCHQVRLAYCARECEVCLFEILHIELQSVQPRFGRHIVHAINRGFTRDMILAPNRCRHRTTISVDGHNVELVPTRALYRRDVETKNVTLLACTFDVN